MLDVLSSVSNQFFHERSTMLDEVPDDFLSHHLRSATIDQIASTTPKGHAPCKKP
jgi:hypothetical protein